MYNRHIRALLIEARPGQGRLIQDALASDLVFHISLTIAESLNSAQDELADKQFDAILVDLSRPDSQGLNTLERVRTITHSQTAIIVLLQPDTNNLDHLGIEAISQGAQDYLVTDQLDGRSLSRALAHAVERQRLLVAVEKQQRVASESQRSLQATLDQLSTERHLLRTLIDNLPDIIYARDKDGHFILANEACALLMGATTPEEMLGKTDFDYYPHDLARRYYDDDLRVMRTGRSLINREEPNVDTEGHSRWLLTTKVALRSPEGDTLGLVGMGRDITDRKRELEALNKRTQEIALLYDASRRLGESLDLETVFDTVYNVIAAGMECDILSIASLNTEQNLLQYIYCRHGSERYAERQLGVVPLSADLAALQREVITTGQAKRLGYDQNHVDHRPLCKNNDLLPPSHPGSELMRSTVLIPLQYEHHAIGLIQIFSAQPQAYNSSNVRFLEALGPQIAAAMINASLYNQAQVEIAERTRAEVAERDQRRFSEALSDTIAVINSLIDLDAVMNKILDMVGDVVTHKAANIMLIDGHEVHIAYTRGYPEQHVESLKNLHFTLKTRNLQQMIQTGQTVLIPDTRQYEGWQVLAETQWVRSHLAAPIKVHTRTIGFIGLESDKPDFFQPRDADRLQIFANQTAIAIENARLYDAVRRYAQELEERVVERTAQLARTTERIETILNNSSDSILVTTASGMIDQVNQSFNMAFGYYQDEIVGQNVSLIAAESSQAALRAALDELLEEGSSQRLEIEARRKDGDTFDADLALSPVILGADAPASIVCSLRDITARKQMEENLRAALDHQRELGEMKTRFVSMVSHEFRTPLTTIQSSSGLLMDYSDRMSPVKQREHLNKIQTQVRRLTDLLDDILTLSKMETASMDFSPVPLDLEALCLEVIGDSQLAAGDSISIQFHHQGKCTRFEADSKLVQHTLNNLLSNAIKYSPEGGTVDFTLIWLNQEVKIQVSDHGIGIPRHDLHRLFEPFYRATNVGTIKGTGLGLAITKNAVDMHGGYIDVESQEGIGTTFTITLPTRQPVETNEHDDDFDH